MKEKLKQVSEYVWELDKNVRPRMRVKAKIIASKRVIGAIDDAAVEQLTNVACLPGVIEPVIGLPDMHWGYGLPMGAVSAFDAEDGVISAGLCGFDINCGINSIRTNKGISSGLIPRCSLRRWIKRKIEVIPKSIGFGLS